MYVVALALLSACVVADDVTYLQYNGDDQSVSVDVGSDTRYVLDDDGVTEVPEAVSVVLTSSTGAVEIGSGTVSPSAGPIGTIHRVSVEISEAYAEDIDRVTVRTDSGDRGEDEYDLERDSAGEGYWVFELESQGEDGEQRTDTLTFLLYEEVASEE
ncbi:MAG: hypothetical protein Q8P18_10800 [Pseudomonadota bacterium]|nr:hypothetical protein [Pseudomonadota bacterium]